jgi:multicomponent Na+:H+ antiporter subunit E
MNALGLGTLLLAIWLLLWGSLSVANVLSGIGVVVLVAWLLGVGRLRSGRPTIRPLATCRFLAAVLVGMVRANGVLTREIVSRQSSITTGVVAVPLPSCSDGLLTLIANVLALTPGTLPLEATSSPAVIYVHVLHLDDVETVRRDVQHLTVLAVRAFGSQAAVESLSSHSPRGAE